MGVVDGDGDDDVEMKMRQMLRPPWLCTLSCACDKALGVAGNEGSAQ